MFRKVCRVFVIALCLASSLLGSSCFHKKEAPAPKPMGYFRIDLPEHKYHSMDTTVPFTFELSKYAEMSVNRKPDGSYWMDVDYPKFNASFKFTYFPLANADSLRNLIIKEEKMVKFHYQKADDVEYSIIQDPDVRIWGQIYDIAGKEVATPFQFWMTDSAHHFLRATLYFNFTPNNDSLQPVIDYLREDAMHLIGTFAWK